MNTKKKGYATPTIIFEIISTWNVQRLLICYSTFWKIALYAEMFRVASMGSDQLFYHMLLSYPIYTVVVVLIIVFLLQISTYFESVNLHDEPNHFTN